MPWWADSKDARVATTPEGAPNGPSPWDSVVFYYRLPFRLPLAPERVHVFDEGCGFADGQPSLEGNPPVVALRLVHVSRSPPTVPREGFDEGLRVLLAGRDIGLDSSRVRADPAGPFYDTWIEAITPHRLLRGEEGEQPPTVWLERCLRATNRLVTAYRAVSGDPDVHHVSAVHLDPVNVLEHLDTRTRERFGLSVMLTHLNLPVARTLVPADCETLLNEHIFQQLAEHPFVSQRDWLERAKLARNRTGDNAGAVVSLQTSAETLFWGIFRSILVDQGLTVNGGREPRNSDVSPLN